jgi:hypothetical protein
VIHPDLKQAIRKLDAAAAQMKAVLLQVQASCKHEQVIHAPWQASDYGAAFKARRLCLQCGLEEEAQNSGWGHDDCDFRRLKTNGFHKVVSRDVIYQNRLPEASVDD